MRRRFAIYSLCIIAIIVVFFGFQYNSKEYVPTESEEIRISEFLEANPDAQEIRGRTYRIYYSDNQIGIAGNQDDASNALKKIKK